MVVIFNTFQTFLLCSSVCQGHNMKVVLRFFLVFSNQLALWHVMEFLCFYLWNLYIPLSYLSQDHQHMLVSVLFLHIISLLPFLDFLVKYSKATWNALAKWHSLYWDPSVRNSKCIIVVKLGAEYDIYILVRSLFLPFRISANRMKLGRSELMGTKKATSINATELKKVAVGTSEL
jgi:hypothetical protein